MDPIHSKNHPSPEANITIPWNNSLPMPNLTAPSPTKSLPLPLASQPVTFFWRYAIAIGLAHALACLAFFPWLFSYTGLAAAIAGHFLFGMFGITIGYHRLLTHRGFTCPKWLEYLFAVLGMCSLQGSPAKWVAIHRIHHKESDKQPDPHSPLAGVYWGHMGWLFIRNRDHANILGFERYVRDLLRDPFYLRLERNSAWFAVYLLHALLFFIVGFISGWWVTGDTMAGTQLGLSLLVWGVFVRTVVVLHGTWAVNSLSHLWGYRNYRTTDNSRNNWLVAMFSHGEGWHNNHHAEQSAASHGHRWFELDMTWWVIRGMEMVGLVRKVVRPKCWGKRVQPSPPMLKTGT